jgi:hypothetical protein
VAFSYEMSPQWRNTCAVAVSEAFVSPATVGGLSGVETRTIAREAGTHLMLGSLTRKIIVFVQETLGSIHNVTRSCGGTEPKKYSDRPSCATA